MKQNETIEERAFEGFDEAKEYIQGVEIPELQEMIERFFEYIDHYKYTIDKYAKKELKRLFELEE